MCSSSSIDSSNLLLIAGWFLHTGWFFDSVTRQFWNNSRTVYRIECWLVAKVAPSIGAPFCMQWQCCQKFLKRQICKWNLRAFFFKISPSLSICTKTKNDRSTWFFTSFDVLWNWLYYVFISFFRATSRHRNMQN